MFPGQGAPLNPKFPEVRGAISELRQLVKNGPLKQHPEGAYYIIGYDESVWQIFGRIAKGLWLAATFTGDRATLDALNAVMWGICGFRVETKDGKPQLFRVPQLLDALTSLEQALDGLAKANPGL
jgi:hypothetical protein